MSMGAECLNSRSAVAISFAFMPQGNGSKGRFRRWLRLTAAPLTAINYAGQSGYPRKVSDG